MSSVDFQVRNEPARDYQLLERYLQGAGPEIPLTDLKGYLNDLARDIKRAGGIPRNKRQWQTLFLESTWKFLLILSRRARPSLALFDPEDVAQDLFLEISSNYLGRLLCLKTASWTTYLHSCIRHKVSDAIRAAKKRHNVPIALEDDEADLALAENGAELQDIEEKLCNKVVLDEIREKLSPQEFFLISSSITLRELAALSGRKPWQIHREKQRIIARLQKLLKERNGENPLSREAEMDGASNKRKYPRVALGQGENLSLGGMFLVADRPPRVRSRIIVDMAFGSPNGQPVRAEAIVRWRKRRRGMGVEFVDFEEQGRDRLNAWLKAPPSARQGSFQHCEWRQLHP